VTLCSFYLQVEFEMNVVHHQTMAALHKKISPGSRVVGYFSTGSLIAGGAALMDNFYRNECPNPVHLTVDTSLRGGRMTVRAFVCRVLTIKGQDIAREFQEVPCEVRAAEAERAGAELLTAELTEKLPGDGEGLATTLDKVDRALAMAESYVEHVLAGRRDGAPVVGRQLAEAMAAVPRLAGGEFEKLMRDEQNDLALTSYLASLVRAHVALADKLGTMQMALV
jgi:translation initiation factor 3 subunit F